MDTSISKLYLYENIRRLLLIDNSSSFCTDNAPMNKRPIKVHKGLDNKIPFRVFDPDRNPVNICKYNIYARIVAVDINGEHELILEKPCMTNSAKGMMFLELNEGDLANMSEGLYRLTIIGQENFVPGVEGEYTATPFYNDIDQNVSFDLLVTSQAERSPVKSDIITESDWTKVRVLNGINGAVVDQYYSSAFKGGRVRNHTNSTHTFSVYVPESTPFTGKLEVLGTLNLTPDADPNNGWFRIHVVSNSEFLEFVNFYGTEAFSFSSNVMWLKFRYTPDLSVLLPGKPNKILVRS